VLVSTALSQPSNNMGKLILYKDPDAAGWQFGVWFPKLNENFLKNLDAGVPVKVLDCDIPEDKPTYIEPETAFDDDDLPSNPFT
jgi:hypothetical protein